MKAIRDRSPASVAPRESRHGQRPHERVIAAAGGFRGDIRKVWAAIHRYLSRRVGDRAGDLLSETFLTAFRKWGEYRYERVNVRQWLHGIGAKSGPETVQIKAFRPRTPE